MVGEGEEKQVEKRQRSMKSRRIETNERKRKERGHSYSEGFQNLEVIIKISKIGGHKI